MIWAFNTPCTAFNESNMLKVKTNTYSIYKFIDLVKKIAHTVSLRVFSSNKYNFILCNNERTLYRCL